MPALKWFIDGQIARLWILHRGFIHACVIDTADLDHVRAIFRTLSIRENTPGLPYVQGTIPGAGRPIALHRYLLGLNPGDKSCGDHIDGNTLNCRRSNLRIATSHANRLNSRVKCTSRTGVRGVRLMKHKYVARVADISLGSFSDIRDAAEAVWLALLRIDPVSAQRFLRSLPEVA